MTHKTITIDLGEKKLILETGKIARQAAGSVMLHCGETTLLATACATAAPASEDVDFLPLKVDYQEKFSSAGKTLGGFIKREGKASTREILISRFIDRTLRPLFDDGYYNDIQVLSYVYSFDGVNAPDVLSICASSAALAISDIPLSKPAGAVRVGMIGDKFIINPTVAELKESSLDLVIGGTEEAILMIEGFCNFLTEEQVLNAIQAGHEAIQKICNGISQWQKEVGKEKNRSTIHVVAKEVYDAVDKLIAMPMQESLTIAHKKTREEATATIQKGLLDALCNEIDPKFKKKDVLIAFKNLTSTYMRKMILTKKIRIDGRKLTEIRPISIETSILPRTHGSALFTRGETQALAVCTLGGETMAQRYEDLHGEGTHRFYLQYFFPPFSVGEVGRAGPPGRRELGHGNLAERALVSTLPSQTEFPYVIRLESNITESNGSSSMASVCGGCLALMDAGVPIKKPIAGIAMGLILENDNYAILSDILGAEDALGDMDFKITGDQKGITAFQMDIKVEGITHEIMKAALMQAKEGRIHILEKMHHALPKAKEQLSSYAPRIVNMQVPVSKIGTIIGPGGKQIRSIIEQTGVDINITDDGIVSITSANLAALEQAQEIVNNLIEEPVVGKVYKGVIAAIKPFGLFVEILAGKQGLVHISEVSHSRINDLNEIYKVGDPMEVKIIEINDRGQLAFSHKALLKKPN